MLGKRIVCSAILMLACGIGAAGQTTSYPARPIKMIVPFPPGGPVDVTARILTQHLPQTLGQPVVVENRAGAAGSLGAKAVASADPDGYTLLCGNISTLVVLPVVSNNRDYDPSKVFVPIAKVSQNHEVLVVHPAFAAKSVPELVAYAKANPGKLNYGSAGHGNATHLVAELFKLRTGVDIVHVPYKGAADAVPASWAGRCKCFSGTSAAFLR
jgi:tripartite-type tricarboxylate transporter receptor subunit TctC